MANEEELEYYQKLCEETQTKLNSLKAEIIEERVALCESEQMIKQCQDEIKDVHVAMEECQKLIESGMLEINNGREKASSLRVALMERQGHTARYLDQCAIGQTKNVKELASLIDKKRYVTLSQESERMDRKLTGAVNLVASSHQKLNELHNFRMRVRNAVNSRGIRGIIRSKAFKQAIKENGMTKHDSSRKRMIIIDE